MPAATMYPLRFAPLFKTALWGGESLRPMLGAPADSEATGEAWILSDVGGCETRVVEGTLAGQTLRELIRRFPAALLGRSALVNERFPLLLKFLDARQNLSIQVHPDDDLAKLLEPDSPGSGKTEAWVILQAQPGSAIYAGLNPGQTKSSFQEALRTGQILDAVHSFQPQPGECIFLPAGTVHAIGAGFLLFEIQQTSAITYRLYDWRRVDPATGKPRTLHLEKSLQCTDFGSGPRRPQVPVELRTGDIRSEILVDCPFFQLRRHHSSQAFAVGTADECRAVVVVAGEGMLRNSAKNYPLKMGDTYLLPAAIGECTCVPTKPLTILECCLPVRGS